jgi:hypothetical protein
MRRFISSFLVLASIVLFVVEPSAAALSQDQLDALNSGVHYFNTESSACNPNLSLTLSGNDQQQQAFNFFVQKGLSEIQSAAIVGNMEWESHLDPTITNGIGAYGLAQWLGGRLDNLKNFASQNNQPVSSFSLQLNFAWYELNGSMQNVLSDLKATDSLDAANHVVFKEYEAPGDSTEPNRLKDATDIYNQYAGSSSSASGSSGCSAVGAGQNTQYVDGFTVYSQYDPTWANKPYGDTTIAAAGCGPSAMAMIITTLTGQSVTPDMTASYADQQNLYVAGAGSSWAIGKTLAEHWGLKATAVGADKAAISAALQSGALVIAAGKGALPFTPSGHFIAIRAVKSDGNWMIGDSGHNDTSTKEWSPDVILSGIQNNGSGGSVYAISK